MEMLAPRLPGGRNRRSIASPGRAAGGGTVATFLPATDFATRERATAELKGYRERAYRHVYWDTGTMLGNLLAGAVAARGSAVRHATQAPVRAKFVRLAFTGSPATGRHHSV